MKPTGWDIVYLSRALRNVLKDVHSRRADFTFASYCYKHIPTTLYDNWRTFQLSEQLMRSLLNVQKYVSTKEKIDKFLPAKLAFLNL